MFTAQEQQKLREIDAVIARGPYQGQLGLAAELPPAALVLRRQVRHLHPLGRLRRAGL